MKKYLARNKARNKARNNGVRHIEFLKCCRTPKWLQICPMVKYDLLCHIFRKKVGLRDRKTAF